MLKSIKIISLISIVTVAYHPSIKAAQELFRFTRNPNPQPTIDNSKPQPKSDSEPTTPAESVLSIAQPAIQGHDEFVMVPKQTEEQIKEEQIKSARAKISKILGKEYSIPELEPQNTAIRYPMPKPSDLWQTKAQRIIEWIEFCCYDIAYSQDPKITEHNSQAIDDLTSQLALEASANQTTIVSLLEQSRQNIIKAGTHVLLLLAAINAHQHPKKINPTYLKTAFERIQKMRENNQARAKVEMAEHYALDNYLKTMQEELSKAHPGAQTSLPATPRKNSLNDFVIDCLQE